MKELLESYVLEAVDLRANAEFLARLVSVLYRDTQDLTDGNPQTINIEDLKNVTVLDIKVVDEVVHIE